MRIANIVRRLLARALQRVVQGSETFDHWSNTCVVLPCTRRKKMRCHAVTQKNVSTTTTTTLVLLAPGWPMHDAQKSAYTLLLPLLKKYTKFAKRKTRLVVSKHQRKSALLDNKNNSHFNINARWVCHKLTFPNWDWKSQLVFFLFYTFKMRTTLVVSFAIDVFSKINHPLLTLHSSFFYLPKLFHAYQEMLWQKKS